MHAPSQESLNAAERVYIDQIVTSLTGRPGSLLGILESVQDHHPHKYLPSETLEYIAKQTRIPLARIYSVVTFYALFNLEPQGDNTICICRGTACHTRGCAICCRAFDWSLASGSRMETKAEMPTKLC